MLREHLFTDVLFAITLRAERQKFLGETYIYIYIYIYTFIYY